MDSSYRYKWVMEYALKVDNIDIFKLMLSEVEKMPLIYQNMITNE